MRWLPASIAPVALLLLVLVAGLSTAACSAPSVREVVVYTSRDQLYAEPVLKAFERETGIQVRAVYDTGATKTAGLTNRLLAERDNPQADVFWNSEVVRTIVLQRAGVLAPYRSPQAADIPAQFKDPDGYWAGFGARARVFIYNTNLLAASEVPASILDLVQPRWRGQVALGTPVLGTMATHHTALFLALGDERARAFFRQLKENQVRIVVGNTAVRDAVSRGEAPLGVIDTSDAYEAIAAGAPVAIAFPDQGGLGALVIPNTVALVAGGPHPENGKLLIDYLLRPETEALLARSRSAQIPVRPGITVPQGVPRWQDFAVMAVDYVALAERLDSVCEFLNELFLR